MQLRDCALVLAAAASLGLAACQRDVQTGSTTRETANPQQADSSGGQGSTGFKKAQPAPGSSGGDAPLGTTGKGNGTNAMGGPGSGLAGGMNPAPGQATGVSSGSTNSTPKNSVGNR